MSYEEMTKEQLATLMIERMAELKSLLYTPEVLTILSNPDNLDFFKKDVIFLNHFYLDKYMRDPEMDATLISRHEKIKQVWNIWEIEDLRAENADKIQALKEEIWSINSCIESKEKEEDERTNSLPQNIRCISTEELARNLKSIASAFKPKANNVIDNWDIACSGKKVTCWVEETSPQLDGEWKAAKTINNKLDEGLKEFAVEATIEYRNLKFNFKVLSNIEVQIKKRAGYWKEGSWIEP